MKIGNKIGIAGIIASSVISITFGILELRKIRRMHNQDIELIVEGVSSALNKDSEKENTEPKVDSK